MTIIDIHDENEATHSEKGEPAASKVTHPFETTPAFVAELGATMMPEAQPDVDVEQRADDVEDGQATDDVDVEFIGAEDFVDVYDYDEPRYEVAAALIVSQDEQGMTKKQFAEELGLKKSQLKRLQCAEADITLGELQRIGALLGKELHIEFR